MRGLEFVLRVPFGNICEPSRGIEITGLDCTRRRHRAISQPPGVGGKGYRPLQEGSHSGQPATRLSALG